VVESKTIQLIYIYGPDGDFDTGELLKCELPHL